MVKEKANATASNGNSVLFARFRTLKPTNNRQDRLVEGWCIPLDNHLFRIFVAEDRTRRIPMGYFIKLMLDWGRNHIVNFDTDGEQFPQTTAIFNTYHLDQWENHGRTIFSYKYIVVGHGNANRDNAVNLMHDIVNHVGHLYGQTIATNH